MMTHLFHVPQYQVLISSIGLVFAVVRHPEGISGEFRKLRRFVSNASRWRVSRGPVRVGKAEQLISLERPANLIREGE